MAIKILVVARNESELKQLERALKLQKFEVTGCTSDDDALRKIQKNAFDALVITNEMPLETKAIFKQFSREQRPGMPVIEVKGSAENLVEEIEAALLDTKE